MAYDIMAFKAALITDVFDCLVHAALVARLNIFITCHEMQREVIAACTEDVQ